MPCLALILRISRSEWSSKQRSAMLKYIRKSVLQHCQRMCAKEKGASDRAKRPIRKLMQCLGKGGGPKQKQESGGELLNSGHANSRIWGPFVWKGLKEMQISMLTSKLQPGPVANLCFFPGLVILRQCLCRQLLLLPNK